ncbi:CehA/McbA family metallohydrolase, partial [bacterium]|nr:CehA/McbA family metallohydrolase [bacterium]
KSREGLEVELISRGSRLSLIQIHFLKEIVKDTDLRIEIPALLPCDRPGSYDLHTFISNSKLDPEPITGPEITVQPGGFDSFDLIYPSTTGNGESFWLLVRARSGYESSYFTSVDYAGEAELSAKGIEGVPERLTFSREGNGFNRCESLKLTSGEGRINVCSKGRELEGHPVIPSELIDGYNLFFGDMHLHTSLSDGMGSPEEVYSWSKNTGLDFVALNDHVEDRLTYNSTWNREKWENILGAAEEYNHPGRFITIPGIEVSGDVNIYFEDESFPYYPFHRLDRNEEALGEFLKKISTDDRVIFGYHKLSELKDYYLKFPQPDLLEVIQHKRDPERGVERFLPLCERSPSFLGSTDSHNGLAASPPMGFSREEAQYGLTGLFAKKLTRKHIFNALRQARTFVTSGQRRILYFKINQVGMGDTLSLSKKRENITGQLLVRAVSEVECVEIICNETVLFTSHPNEKSVDLSINLEKIHEYEVYNGNKYFVYARIREASGKMAWTSPVLVRKI